MARVVVAVLTGAASLTTASAPPAGAVDHCVGSGQMSVGSPGLQWVLVGPAVTLPWAMSMNIGLCASLEPVWMSGTVTGNCGLLSGAGTTNRGDSFSFVGLLDKLILTGDATGYADWQVDVLTGASCLTGATRFLVFLDVTLLSGLAPATG